MSSKEWDKLSNDYYGEILSPIKDSKTSPLLTDLKKIKSKNKRVIDLGCGLGELEPLLSKYFSSVLAVDISKEMIKKASEKNKTLKNVSFQVFNIENLPKIKEKYSLALSINSILTPNLKSLDKIFLGIHKILKRKGKFLAVLPAMEVYAYQALLLAESQVKRTKDHVKIRRKVKQTITDREHDFLLGIYNFRGKQKAFYRFEILHRLKKAGFKNIKISKVEYSWKTFENAGQCYFPKAPLNPWDWYVYCEK